VDEHILAAGVGLDEAEGLLAVEPKLVPLAQLDTGIPETLMPGIGVIGSKCSIADTGHAQLLTFSYEGKPRKCL
jgi:hypothetical protein